MAAGIAALAAAVYALMWVGYRQRWAWLYRVDWSLLDGARALAIKHPSGCGSPNRCRSCWDRARWPCWGSP